MKNNPTVKIVIAIVVIAILAVVGYYLFNKITTKYEQKERAEFARDTATDLVGAAMGGLRS
jgi:hypothetical protein